MAMRWLDALDGAVGRLLDAGRWLVLPVTLILFLQWPLRDLVRAGSRDANDLGQWIFALYVGLAVSYATRQRAHLAVDAVAQAYGPRLRAALARWGGFACVAPWSLFVLWTASPTVLRSVLALEKFPETFNPGYFLVKLAALLLAGLMLTQAVLDLLRPARA